MDNYTKGEVVEVEEPPVFSLNETGVNMRVASGSKVRNLMGFAIKKMKEPAVNQMCWNGSGNAVTKTVSCAEIMKRKFKGLHQLTRIRYRLVEEYWEPKLEGLERLKVNKNIPAISILLSKEPLDTAEPGYQPPGVFDEFWKDIVETDRSKNLKEHQQRGAKCPGASKDTKGKDTHTSKGESDNQNYKRKKNRKNKNWKDKKNETGGANSK